MYASGFMRILTSPDREGHCVSTLIPKRLPEKMDPTLMMRWNMWSMERMARNPYFQACGDGGRSVLGFSQRIPSRVAGLTTESRRR